MKIKPLIIMDTDFIKQGLIENGDIIWNEKFYEMGEFEIFAPATDRNLTLLQKNYYVLREDSDYVGIIEKIEVTASVDDGDYITATGYFAENLLNRRVIYKQTQLNSTLEKACRSLIDTHFINPTESKRKVDIIGYTNINKDLANIKIEKQITGTAVGTAIANMCETKAVGFKMPLQVGKITYYRNIRVGDDLSGKTVYFDCPDNLVTKVVNGAKPIVVNNNNYLIETKKSLAWNNTQAELFLSENGVQSRIYNYIRIPKTVTKIEEVTLPDDFGVVTAINTNSASYQYIKIVEKEVEGTAFTFQLYTGTDRSYRQNEMPWVVFAEKYDNLSKSEYVWDSKDTGNYAYVAGEGEGTKRVVVELELEKNVSGLDRHEKWVDARDLQRNEESTSLAKYKEQLKQRGREKVKITSETFNGDVILNNYEYKKDFFIGDVVTVITRFGEELNLRVIEVIESQDEKGYEIKPIFIDVELEGKENEDL